MSDLPTVAATGDQLKTLKVLRDDLAARMMLSTSDQNYSVMARIFVDAVDKIATLEGKTKGSGGTALDELSRKRSALGRTDATSATGSARTTKRG